MSKIYECVISFTYEAENPVDAANQFIANIQNNPNWNVLVKDCDNFNRTFTVDTETGECSSNAREDFEFDLSFEYQGVDFQANRTFDTDSGNGFDIFANNEFVLQIPMGFDEYAEDDEQDIQMICEFLFENYF
jgi:hypothetical protein